MLQQWTVPNQGPHKGHTSHWSVIVRLRKSTKSFEASRTTFVMPRQVDEWRAEEASNCPHKLTKPAEPWLGGGAASGGSELHARVTSAAVRFCRRRVGAAGRGAASE